jgi:hypothetical protein
VHNGCTRVSYGKGDVERGFREADLVLEHTFRVPGLTGRWLSLRGS